MRPQSEIIRAKTEDELAAAIILLMPRHRGRILAAIRQYGGLRYVPEVFWRELARDVDAAVVPIILDSMVRHYGRIERNMGADGTPPVDVAASATGAAAVLAIALSNKWIEDMRSRLAGLDTETNRTAILDALGDATDESLITRAARDTSTRARTIAVSSAGEDLVLRQAEAGDGLIADEPILAMRYVWTIHPELSKTGPCEICEPLDGTTGDVWGLEFPSGPPAHPNCVCDLTPIIA